MTKEQIIYNLQLLTQAVDAGIERANIAHRIETLILEINGTPPEE